MQKNIMIFRSKRFIDMNPLLMNENIKSMKTLESRTTY